MHFAASSDDYSFSRDILEYPDQLCTEVNATDDLLLEWLEETFQIAVGDTTLPPGTQIVPPTSPLEVTIADNESKTINNV